MIEITSDSGRIGPFWWVNADTRPRHLHDWVYAGSHHIAWRPGVSDWFSPLGKKFYMVLIEQ